MKKGTKLADMLKNSFIIGWLITFADYLYSRIPDSVIVQFFSNYKAFEKNYADSRIGQFFSRFKVSRIKTVEMKQAFSRKMEQSIIRGMFRQLKEKLLTARLRTYGSFLFSYGLICIGINALKIFIFHTAIDIFTQIIPLICVLIGAVWALSKKPVGQALYESIFIGGIMRSFIGVRRDEVCFDTVNDRGITLGFLLGAVLGLMSFIVPPIMIFGAVIALLMLYLMGTKPEFGIVFIAFSLPFMPTMAMCGLTIFCTMAFILKVARGKRTFRFEAIDMAVLVFMVFIFFGGTVSVDFSTSVKSAAVFLALMLNYFLVANLIRNRTLTVRILQSFSLSMLVTALIGLYQKFFMAANTTWHDTTMFGDIGTRIYSTFQNPNVYGEYLVMAIPLSLALLFTQKTYKERFMTFVITACALMALVYTQSRGAWLAFLISIAIYLLIKTSKMLVVYLLGIFSIPILPFVLPQSIVSRFMSIGNLGDSSTSYRVSIWRAAVKMIEDFFTGGIGIGTTAFSKVYPSYSLAGIEAAPHSHQLFFQIAIEMGFFALIAFFAVIFILIRKNSHTLMEYGKKSGYTLISSAALCGIIGMMIQGLTDYVWYNYRVFGMFWIVMGLCVSALRCAENEKDKERV
ncbi:MAG: hypothetical protein E7588_05965 [Ruminococcaceae bacterium]|nr:hypothetical protein [Oscillospiraceae bacterium]